MKASSKAPSFSDAQFEYYCAPGKWLEADFYPVANYNPLIHAFQFICVGGKNIEPAIPTRVEGRFVKVWTCEFVLVPGLASSFSEKACENQ